MPPVIKLKKNFLASCDECRDLFNYCLRTDSPASNAGIEAAFLQLFKSWEFFLEEAVLAYMCGRLCCDGTSVVSHLKVQSEEIARGILYQNRPFVEWTDVEAVRARLMSYFPNPNRIDGALAPSVAYLKQMTRIRNAIAHTSKPSRDGFDKLVQSLYGGKVSFPRASKLLTAPHIHDRNKTFFDVYVTVLEIAAGSITG